MCSGHDLWGIPSLRDGGLTESDFAAPGLGGIKDRLGVSFRPRNSGEKIAGWWFSWNMTG